jgi:NAD(P)H-hydrate epimerase
MQQVVNLPQLPPRKAGAHKGDFGRVCIIGGSRGMSGAPAIAGRSALRAGAGLVRVAVPAGVLGTVASIEPSYTTIALPEDSAGRISARAASTVLEAASENDVLAFGPGTGKSGGLRTVLAAILEQEIPLVIDADGLNNLAMIKNWPQRLKAHLVLTPHPGEMKRIWAGLFREQLPADRSEQAISLASRTGTIAVLKGAGTVVTDGRKVYVNTTGNPGMATGGSGDSLTGVIAALAGQGLGGFEAAVLGTYIHGLAGDIAAEKFGRVSMIATDIVDCLAPAIAGLRPAGQGNR